MGALTRPPQGERPDTTDIDDSKFSHVSHLTASTTQQESSRREGSSPRTQKSDPTNVLNSTPTASKLPQQSSPDWMKWFQDQLGTFAQENETPPDWMLQALYSSVGTAAMPQQRDQTELSEERERSNDEESGQHQTGSEQDLTEVSRSPSNSGHQTGAAPSGGPGTREGASSTRKMLSEGVQGRQQVETRQHDPRPASSALSHGSSDDIPVDGVEMFEDKELRSSTQDEAGGNGEAGNPAGSNRDDAAGSSPVSPHPDVLDGASIGPTVLNDEEAAHRVVASCHQARAGNTQEWSTQHGPFGGNHEFHVVETKETQTQAASSTYGPQRGYQTAFDGVESHGMQRSSNQGVMPGDYAMYPAMGIRQGATYSSPPALLQHDHHQRVAYEREIFSSGAAPWSNRRVPATTFPPVSRYPGYEARVSDSSPGFMSSASQFTMGRFPGWGKDRDENLGREELLKLVSQARNMDARQAGAIMEKVMANESLGPDLWMDIAIALLKNARLREVDIDVIKEMLQILLSKESFEGTGEDADWETQRYAGFTPEERNGASKPAGQRWRMGPHSQYFQYKKKELTEAAMMWIRRRWGNYQGTLPISENKERLRRRVVFERSISNLEGGKFQPESYTRSGESRRPQWGSATFSNDFMRQRDADPGQAVTALEALCEDLSALTSLPYLSEEMSTSQLLHVAQGAWPFKADDKVDLLHRFLWVIGGDGTATDEAHASGKGDAEDYATLSLAPLISQLLERKCEEIVRTLSKEIGHWAARNYGATKKALAVIRENLDPGTRDLATGLLRIIAFDAAGVVDCPDPFLWGSADDTPDPRVNIDKVLTAPELWFFMLNWVDSLSDKTLNDTGMHELIFDIRRQSCALAKDILDGNVLSGKLEELLPQVEAIAKFSPGVRSKDGEGNEQVTGALLRSSLEQYWAARSAFAHVLDGAKKLATLCSDMIGVNVDQVARTIERLQGQEAAGELLVRNLSQNTLLSSALDISEDSAAGIPLSQLRVLALSEVFHRILKEQATAVRNESDSEGLVSSQKTADPEEPTMHHLGIHDAVNTVIPRALARWKSLAGDVLSDEMSSDDVHNLFHHESTDRREVQVRLLVFVGAEPMADVPLQVEQFIMSSSNVTLLGRLRKSCQSGYGEKERRVRQILASLEAHKSIKWFVENIAGLLRAYRVLYSPTTVPVDDDGEEDLNGEVEGLATVVEDDDRENEDSDEDFVADSDGANLKEATAVEVTPTKVFSCSPDSDPFRQRLQEALDDLQSRSGGLSMANAREAWGRIDDSNAPGGDLGGLIERSRTHIELLIRLSSYPRLVNWLIEHNSDEEFNELLHVGRSCTDEGGLLSSIASLVEIRSRMHAALYPIHPFKGLGHLLRIFAEVPLDHDSVLSSSTNNRSALTGRARPSDGKEENLVWHMANAAGRFDGLTELFERQTLSPGVQALHTMEDILKSGTFVIRASSAIDAIEDNFLGKGDIPVDAGFVLTLDLESHPAEETVDNSDVDDDISDEVTAHSLNQEGLMGLRARLAFMDVTAEQEESWVEKWGQGLRAAVDALKVQLQTSSDILAAAEGLRKAGHPGYQQQWEMREKFRVGNDDNLVYMLRDLQSEEHAWNAKVREARKRWPCLNHFTMREILRLEQHRSEWEKHQQEDLNGHAKFAASAVREFLRLARSNVSLGHAVELLRRWGDLLAGRYGGSPLEVSAVEDLDFAQNIPIKFKSAEDTLESLGRALMDILRADADSLRRLPPPEAGTSLFDPLVATSAPSSQSREQYENMTTDGSQCLFVACTAEPDEVIRVALSVYVRRRRLPMPGELVFCTAETSDEDLELAVRRFADQRRRHQVNHAPPTGNTVGTSGSSKASPGGDDPIPTDSGREGVDDSGVYIIANVHRLSYTRQAVLRDHIRTMVLDSGNDEDINEECDERASQVDGAGSPGKGITGGALLLVISGEPRQAILTWLSGHLVNLPPLPVEALRLAVAYALRTHYDGETFVVRSTTNGGGKTHTIMKRAQKLPYIRVVVGESFAPRDLYKARLERSLYLTKHPRSAFHLDVGHVPPVDCNIYLFQLLLEGCVRDVESGDVVVREAFERYYIEVPNAEHDSVWQALHVCDLLPVMVLKVTPQNLDLELPVLKDNGVEMETNSDLSRAYRWLRALEQGDLLPDNQGADPAKAAIPVAKEECFKLLRRCAFVEGGPSERPSWAVLQTFVKLLGHQLDKVERYPLLGAEVARRQQYEHGLETFRHVFVQLLVECTKDFALRSVPQIHLMPSDGAVNEEDKEGDGGTAPRDGDLGTGSRRLASRFQALVGWEKADHPVVIFKSGQGPRGEEIAGIDILSLNRNRSLADTYIKGNLKEALALNRINFEKDWTCITREEAVHLLRDVGGVNIATSDAPSVNLATDIRYVFTVDNLLKMLSITLRLQARMPVLIMGETGCGKSSLITCMCEILGWKLDTLNVHSGLSHGDITAWVKRCAASCPGGKEDPPHLMLLDEINACNSVGLFKEIICDGTVGGNPLPCNLRVVAACNPYRLRTDAARDSASTRGGARMERQNVGLTTAISDPIKDLVYRVHPLPESLVDHIMDYGSLQPDTEKMYIVAMLNNLLRDPTENVAPNNALVAAYAACLCTAQESIRGICGGEKATVSLRDVSRCIKVFLWLGHHWVTHGSESLVGYVKNKKNDPRERTMTDFLGCFGTSPRAAVRRSMVLALAYSYQARLARNDRSRLVTDICQATVGFPSWIELDPKKFAIVVDRVTKRTAENMKLGRGVAANEALCENLFVLMISVLNSIPVFVVGKPGSSKSLAVSVLRANLNGRASATSFLRTFPAVEVFFHQCSPQSTSQGILQTFNIARKYHGMAPDTVVVVLLDEVGLAEQSPHLPLKVLHKILDEAREGETLVGISNWELDSAKMNRAVHLHRPPPTVDDLALTAEGMLQDVEDGGTGEIGDKGPGRTAVRRRPSHQLLSGIAQAYFDVYDQQRLKEFWGLREFYATVRALGVSHMLEDQQEESKRYEYGWFFRKSSSTESPNVSPALLARAVLRNFGGRPPGETRAVLELFFTGLLKKNAPPPEVLPGVDELIRQNLSETQARHLMLLTKTNAALSLLFELGLLQHRGTTILFGSDFPGDRTDTQVTVDIQQVKGCMARGGTLVLVHCERLYESLYDLLNQHYTECVGKLSVRLAIGAHSELCPLDPHFRVVVVVESSDAYERLPAPLLNRFEKQILGWEEALDLRQQRSTLPKLLRRVMHFAISIALGRCTDGRNAAEARLGDMRRAFPGYGKAFLPSLVLTVSKMVCNRGSRAPSATGATAKSEDGIDADDFYGGAYWDSTKNEGSFDDVLYSSCKAQLLKVATPEVMCKLAGRSPSEHDFPGWSWREDHVQEIELTRASDYFREHAHGSLEDFSRCALHRSHHGCKGQNDGGSKGDTAEALVGTCAIIMTYAPLEGEAAAQGLRSVMGGSWRVRHLMIHELSQERELVARLNDFFAEDCTDEVLLLQCDLQAYPTRIVEHIKFVVDAAREGGMVDKELQDRGRPIKHGRRIAHVLLLLHLVRGADDFNMSFESRWECIFVDSVGDGNWSGIDDSGLHLDRNVGVKATDVLKGGIPSAVKAAGKSALEIARGLDPSQAMLATLRGALANLAYSEGRRRDIAEVRLQMRILLEACSGRGNATNFVSVIWSAILSRLRSDEGYGAAESAHGYSAKVKVKEEAFFAEQKNERHGDDGWEEHKGEDPVVYQREPGSFEKSSLDRDAKKLRATSAKDAAKAAIGGTNVALTASEERQLRVSGTFQRAIRASVLGAITRAFSAVLAHMDRNSALRLLQGDHALCETWLELFKASFDRMSTHVVAITAEGVKTGNRKHDSAGGAVSTPGLRGEDRFAVIDSVLRPGEELTRSHFPFSFYIYRLLEDLGRSKHRGTPGILVSNTGDEEVIAGEFALLQLGSRVHGALSRSTMDDSRRDRERISGEGGKRSPDEDFLRRYLHDFTCMMLPPVKGISRAEQARYVLILIDLTGPGSPEDGQRRAQGDGDGNLCEATTRRACQWVPTTSIAAVHQRFWRAGYAIRRHLDLLGAAGVPCFRVATNIVEERLRDAVSGREAHSTGCYLDGILHLRVARATQEAILASLGNVSLLNNNAGESTAESWATLDVLDSVTNELLATCAASCSGDSHGRKLLSEVVEGFEKLKLMGKLILEVVQPLELPENTLPEVLGPLTKISYPVRSEQFLQAVVEALSLLSVRSPQSERQAERRAPFASSGRNHRFIASESDPRDVLPRFLEHYLSEILVPEKAFSEDHEERFVDGRNERVTPRLWSKVVALLSADVDLLRQGGWSEQIVRHPVFPTEAASARILRRMRNTGTVDTVRAVTAGLETAFQSAGRLDNRLAACFVAAVEDNTSVNEAMDFVRPATDAQDLDLLQDSTAGSAVESTLTVVAHLRRVARAAADSLCQEKGSGVDVNSHQGPTRTFLGALTLLGEEHGNRQNGEKDAATVEAIPGVSRETGSPSLMPTIRSLGARFLGMFFLRQVVLRQDGGGEEFLRAQLMRRPLNEYPWLHIDERISAFSSASDIPQVNPLLRVPLFRECRAILAVFMASGDLAQLEGDLQKLIEDQTSHGETTHDWMRPLKAGFLAAAFHEVNLVEAKAGRVRRSGSRLLLEEWLRQKQVPRCLECFTLAERRMVSAAIGAGDRHTTAVNGTSGDHQRDEAERAMARDFISLSSASSAEDVLWARLAVHVVSAIISADHGSPMELFADFLSDPGRLREDFIPTMDSGTTMQQINAFGAALSTKTYQCECGYIYQIGDCGRPWEQQVCPEKGCDRMLGGTNHVPAQANADKVTVQEPKGYCLDTIDKDGPRTMATRNLSGDHVATTRLIIHLAGIFGAAADAGWPGRARGILNHAHVKERPPTGRTGGGLMGAFLRGLQGNAAGGGVIDIFLHGLQGNVKTLRRLSERSNEHVALGIHMTLWGLVDAEGHHGVNSRVPVENRLRNEQQRHAWEDAFRDQYLAVLSGDREVDQQRLLASAEELRAGGDAASFTAELLGETAVGGGDVRQVGGKANSGGGNTSRASGNRQGRASTTGLWGMRHSFSIEDFTEAFLSLGDTSRGNGMLQPLLATLTNSEKKPVLRVLARLPAAIQWVRILKEQFEGKASREETRSLTAGRVLAKASVTDRASWTVAFQGFIEAWRYGRDLVDRWECQPIPPGFSRDSVDHDTPISFLLPSPQDEGIFPLALLTSMVEWHNEIVRNVKDARRIGGWFRAGKMEEVEAMRVNGSHAIDLDLDNLSGLILKSQCRGALGIRPSYDFDRAEEAIEQAKMLKIPLIRMEKNDIIFKYQDEEAGGAGGTLLGKLGEKIAQKRLARKDVEAIARDLSTPALAQSLLDMIGPAISILASVGGSLVQRLPEDTGTMMLSDFLRDVLRIDGGRPNGTQREVLPLAVARHVRLLHLVELWDLALSCTEREWTSGVSPRYREELPPGDAHKLVQSSDAMDLDVLLPLLKEYIRSYLGEDSPTAPGSTLKENLAWMPAAGDSILDDMPWFRKHWPDNIEMRYAVSVFRILDGRRSIE